MVIFGHLLMTVRIAWAWQNGAPSRWLLQEPQPTVPLQVGGGIAGIPALCRGTGICPTWWDGGDSLIWTSRHQKKPKSRFGMTTSVCNSICGWQLADDPAGPWQVFLRLLTTYCLQWLEVFLEMHLPNVCNYRVMDHSR